jgi:transcriptional regulator with XRE-family HTH domain
MPISENIKKLREIHNLSQKELANIAGVTDKAVSTWELGIKEPRMGAIEKIANHFGLQKSNIIEDNGLSLPKADSTVKITPEEEMFLEKIKALPDEDRKSLEQFLNYLSLKKTENEDAATTA